MIALAVVLLPILMALVIWQGIIAAIED